MQYNLDDFLEDVIDETLDHEDLRELISDFILNNTDPQYIFHKLSDIVEDAKEIVKERVKTERDLYETE